MNLARQVLEWCLILVLVVCAGVWVLVTYLVVEPICALVLWLRYGSTWGDWRGRL